MSSFFPHAQVSRLPPQRPPSAPEIAYTPLHEREASADPSWRGIRAVAEAGTAEGADQQLTFPAVRSALWDRTPQDASVVLDHPHPRVALAPCAVAPLAMRARTTLLQAGDAGAAALAAHVYLSGEVPELVRGSWSVTSAAGREVIAPVDVTALSLETGVSPSDATKAALTAATAATGAPAWSAASSGKAQTQPAAIVVHTRAWPAAGGLEGRGLEGRAEDYEALLQRCEQALRGGGALAVGETMPM